VSLQERFLEEFVQFFAETILQSFCLFTLSNVVMEQKRTDQMNSINYNFHQYQSMLYWRTYPLVQLEIFWKIFANN